MTLSVFVVLFFLFYALKSAPAASAPEQLIIFVQPGASELEKVFHEKRLPEIRKLAEAMGVPVDLVDARKGSPKEVAITPLITYQNHRGRSIYQGRTTTPERIRNFIRTFRYAAQAKATTRREDIPIWQNGRVRIWAPLNVAGITGTLPQDYDPDAFVKYARKQIVAGFKRFRIQKRADLGRADRGFYMEVYPRLSEDGRMFLDLALFSQFNYRQPLFEKTISRPWAYRKKLFRSAAVIMEEKVAEIISDPESGDSFNPIRTGAVEKNWDDIGYPLPPAPKTEAAGLATLTGIAQNWVLTESGPEDPPMIRFRFPAPLDDYNGKVLSAEGKFYLPDNLRVDGARGFIEIDTQNAITTGDPVYDEVIRSINRLDSKKYPIAKFVLKSITSDGQPIAYGHLTPANVAGTLILKGKNAALTCLSEFEPIIGRDGKPQLLVRGSFAIDLQVFNVRGLDGPAPASNTLLLDVNLILEAVSGRPPA
jgi:polyisoprenoid-binding protein YceI